MLFVMCQPDLGRDEFTFRPLGHRLSFVSSPESDYETAAGGTLDTNDSEGAGRRPARASSDPNIAVIDNIPPHPVEPPPPPPPPKPEIPPHLGYHPYYVCTMHIAEVLVVLYFCWFFTVTIFIRGHNCTVLIMKKQIGIVFLLSIV